MGMTLWKAVFTISNKVENAQIMVLNNSTSICITKRQSHKCPSGYVHKFILTFIVHSRKKMQTTRLILSPQKKMGREKEISSHLYLLYLIFNFIS